ncbi:hypothetical protein ACFLIM_33570 [Nonomuraea sp. M3C6]|uniref:Uncharacterized protein n=1 Tax=Nonomuraea marmarensis TaxID=3351344 RepID=A0ABW7APH0_9ACTN
MKGLSKERTTFQAWVALQPAWLASGALWPEQGRITVYACVPIGIVLAWAANRLKLPRIPTLFGLVTATAMYLCADKFGIHQAAVLALADAPHKLVVSSAMITMYAAMEIRIWIPGQVKRMATWFAHLVADALKVEIPHPLSDTSIAAPATPDEMGT